MTRQQLRPRETGANSGVGRATGFELARRGQPSAANIESALERNRAFAAASGHEGAVVFPNLRLFVITCLDPRTDPAHFLALGLRDAMVVRNVGGRVTPEVINDVAFIGQLAESASPDGPLFEVAVIHHTQCGTGALVEDSFRRRYAERIGADESILSERLVATKSMTLAAVPDRYCGGAGLRGRTLLESAGWTGPPSAGSCFAASVESRLARCERRGGRWCLRGRAVYFVL